MSRRGSNVFAGLFKAMAESAMGKIYKGSAYWIFSDKGWTRKDGYHFPAKASEDNGGRMVSLKPGLSARNCPMPPGDYVKNERGRYAVPMSKCSKCEHRLPRLCCAELRRIAKAGPSPAEQLGEMVGKAVKTAEEIIGRPL